MKTHQSRAKARYPLLGTHVLREGTAARRRLVLTVGPLFSEEDVAARLGVTVSTAMGMFVQGQLIAVKHELALRFPAWQFDGASVRWFIAQLIAATGSPGAAFHFIAVPRRQGNAPYHPYLAEILANNIPAIHEMLERAESLRER